MAHVFAVAFQQARWIREFGAMEEPDMDMGFERVDVGEGSIIDARGGMPVVQELSNIVAAVAHDLKPALRDCPQFT